MGIPWTSVMLLFGFANAFTLIPFSNTQKSLINLNGIVVAKAPAEGKREIVDGPDGSPIIVANVGGSYYAVDAMCPHLNLPMKRGKILPEGPTLVCNFHNSEFNMQSGVCTKWITGTFGIENEFIANVMSKAGGGKSDITAYTVEIKADGSLELSKA